MAQSSTYRNFPFKADDIFKINVASTFELLEWCINPKINKQVNSSGNVYGDQSSLLKETFTNKSSSFMESRIFCRKNISELFRVFFR